MALNGVGPRHAGYAALHHKAYREMHLVWPRQGQRDGLPSAQTRYRPVFQALTGPCAVPDYSDLKPARRAKNLPSPPPNTSRHGQPESANSNSVNAQTPTSPTARVNGSKRLDTQEEHQTLVRESTKPGFLVVEGQGPMPFTAHTSGIAADNVRRSFATEHSN